LQGFLGALRTEFGVDIVDARLWVADEDYNDSHHLLQSGAARFTERLTAEHLVPWLREDLDAGR
jgi:hypothetical protein